MLQRTARYIGLPSCAHKHTYALLSHSLLLKTIISRRKEDKYQHKRPFIPSEDHLKKSVAYMEKQNAAHATFLKTYS